MAGRKTRKKVDSPNKNIPDVKSWADVYTNYGTSKRDLDDVSDWKTCEQVARTLKKSPVRTREILRRAVEEGAITREKKTILINGCVRTVDHYKLKD